MAVVDDAIRLAHMVFTLEIGKGCYSPKHYSTKLCCAAAFELSGQLICSELPK